MTSAISDPEIAGGLGVVGSLRWAWRQLTSMRTALLLLLLLAIASVPGSVLPQRAIDSARTDAWIVAHPHLGPLFDRLGAFSAYSSPWFAAVYLLLFTSLAGCVLPRARTHALALTKRPPAAPRYLDRLAEHRTWETDEVPDDVLRRARVVLRHSRFRTLRDGTSVAAEKGYLRETGNLVFHLALLALLIAFAASKLLAYTGDKVIVEGEPGFTNGTFDSSSHGALFSSDSLNPITVRLDSFTARYQTSGDQTGAPRDYQAKLSWEKAGTDRHGTAMVAPNHPLEVDGTKFFLTGNGYAPAFTFTDGAGQSLFDGPLVLLPRDGFLTSSGALKLPDAKPQSLGMQVFFLPTAAVDNSRGPVSSFPAPNNPKVLLNVLYGDLHDTRSQSAYVLDSSAMKPVMSADDPKKPFLASLSPGQSVTIPPLPGTTQPLGTLTFVGVKRFVNLQVSDTSGDVPAVIAAGLAILGLMMSLLLPRRRLWVRATRSGGRTVVEVAAMARGDADGLGAQVDRIADGLRVRPSARSEELV